MNSTNWSQEIVDRLESMRFESVFNPYHDVCKIHDSPHSPETRCTNLRHYLTRVYEIKPKTAWFGRDLGYRGGRRTGLPLTDEPHLEVLEHTFGTPTIQKATMTSKVCERTAAEIWGAISRIKEPPFLWNAFPLHPHEELEQLSNRSHTRTELNSSRDLLDVILGSLKFSRIFALGRDAAAALDSLGASYQYIRHPSYGGQMLFRQQIAHAYKLPTKSW